MQSDNGVFWIDYASLLRFFQGVYLNWNPQLFAHTTSHHGQWPQRVHDEDDTISLGRNPQYSLTLTVSGGTPAAVWLLLSRHTTKPFQEKMGKDYYRDDFLTVHVFQQRGGYRVYYLEECWRQGVYSNRPHCLVKFDLPPGSHKLTLALAQYKAVDHQVDYTLKASRGTGPFARAHLRCSPSAPRPVCTAAPPSAPVCTAHPVTIARRHLPLTLVVRQRAPIGRSTRWPHSPCASFHTP